MYDTKPNYINFLKKKESLLKCVSMYYHVLY